MSIVYDTKKLRTNAGNDVDHAGLSDGVALCDGAHGKLYDAAINGRLFMASNQAAVATTANLNTTWTGLGIANPSGSGKNLVLHRFSWALNVVGPDEGYLGLMQCTDSGFADAITIKPALLSVSAQGSVAFADDGATIVSPYLLQVVSTYGTGAITTWQGAGWQHAELDGSIIVPPGMSIATCTGTATTAAFVFSFLWEEVATTVK